MEAYSYTDIFDTKGIEYLVVIGFLLIIVPVWIMISRPVNQNFNLIRSINGLSAAILRIPRGLFYNRNHTWTYLEKTGTARVGLDDLLLHLTGGVSVEFLRSPGEKIYKGDLIAMVSHDNRNLKISSPISGEIQKLNSDLKERKGLINIDPYGKGWICKVKPEKWQEEISCCKMDEEAVAWSENELSRCRDFLTNAVRQLNTGTVDVILQEGGVLTDFPLADMPGEVWNKFQKEFLD